MSNLLSQAIYFCKDKTGDELWDEVGDAFIFSSERRGAISINSEIDQHISDIRDRLIGTSETARDEVRWSKPFRGRRHPLCVLQPSDQISVAAA